MSRPRNSSAWCAPRPCWPPAPTKEPKRHGGDHQPAPGPQGEGAGGAGGQGGGQPHRLRPSEEGSDPGGGQEGHRGLAPRGPQARGAGFGNVSEAVLPPPVSKPEGAPAKSWGVTKRSVMIA